jgi:hypothetical protein
MGIEIEAQKDQDEDHLVMSYHLFVHSYRIRHGDVIHANVRNMTLDEPLMAYANVE